MKSNKHDIRHKGALLFLFGAVLFFFFDVLFLGKVFYAGDNLAINVPSKMLLIDMVRQGRLPLWNPYIFAGSPFLADINLGLLFPLNVLYFIFSPLRSLTLTIVIDVFLSGVFMYFWAVSCGISNFSSLAAALVFMFSGSIMTYTLNTPILNSVVLMPLVFFLIEKRIRTGHIKYALLTSIAFAIQIFAGHIQFFYYTSIFAVLYLFFRSKDSIASRIILAFTIFVPALCLSAIQFVPFLELSRFSTRPSFDFTYASSASPTISLLHVFFVNIFGVFKQGTSWGAMADTNGYIGIVPLILAVFAFRKVRNSFVTISFWAGIATFCIAVGKYSPLYYLAFYALPFFSRFRSPPSILIIYTLFFSLAAGYGFQYVMSKKSSKSLHIPATVLITCALILFIMMRFTAYPVFLSSIQHVNAFIPTHFLTRFLHYPAYQIRSIFTAWMDNAIVILVFLCGFMLVTQYVKTCRSALSRFIFLLLILLDVTFFAKNNYLVTTEKVLTPPPKALSFITDNLSYGRIHTLRDEGKKPVYANANYFIEEAMKGVSFFAADTNVMNRIQSIEGYASIVNKNYASYMNSKNTDPTGIDLPTPDMTQLNELGVKYILTAGRYLTQLQSDKSFEEVMAYRNENYNRTFYLFENKKAKPRAYLLDTTGMATGSARIILYEENSVRIITSSSSSAKLILADMYYPGWEATVNRTKTPITPYTVFRSVPVPKGENTVFFTYNPKSFMIGAAISAANWIYILFFLFFAGNKRHRSIRQKLHIRKSRIKKNPR